MTRLLQRSAPVLALFFVSIEERLSPPQLFFEEAVMWNRLKHQNLVPFIGVVGEPLQMVSEWIPNGTLTKYVEKDPGVDRLGLVSLSYINHT